MLHSWCQGALFFPLRLVCGVLWKGVAIVECGRFNGWHIMMMLLELHLFILVKYLLNVIYLLFI